MKKLFLLLILPSYLLQAQEYSDYLGAGHATGITVTTSHNANSSSDGSKTIDGFHGHNTSSLKDASRFLSQATLGYDYATIEEVASSGFESWIESQMQLPLHLTMPTFLYLDETYEEDELFYGMFTWRNAWWNNQMNHHDLLRKKMAYALSQIFVVSGVGSDFFEDVGPLTGNYYDILTRNAFGNFHDLLSEVSLSPSMGVYLNHMHNPKSDPANNIHPDENYAREVMQLFSIGLYELNPDGTRKKDGLGKDIPTYNNDDIREFAKIFTGFGNPGEEMVWGVFGEDEANDYGHLPMLMYEEWHEPGQKFLLNGTVVPDGQTGMQDFEMAMDNLFNHPNVGPFIGKKLIQFFTTSNPSSFYVERVAAAFNDNGNGVRGDLKAVLKAILLDPEARNCSPGDVATGGKLREPLARFTQFLKAFHAKSDHPQNQFEYLLEFERWGRSTGQIPMFSPSVFNFYLPEFQPNGPVAEADLVGPEFQIHNSSTAVGYINEVHFWTFEQTPFEHIDYELAFTSVNMDYTEELAIAEDPEALVNHMDILLAGGLLTEQTKQIITQSVAQLDDNLQRVHMAIYPVMISPDYTILK